MAKNMEKYRKMNKDKIKEYSKEYYNKKKGKNIMRKTEKTY